MAGRRKADGSTRSTRRAARKVARRHETRGQKARRWLKGTLVWGAVTGLVLALVAVASFVYLYKTIDIPDAANAEALTETTFVYYDGGKTELGRFDVQNRTSLTLDEMPESVENAVVAAENKTFWTDKGLDPKGILRAAFSNASGGSTQGASTITQQYVKNLYLTQERSYQRKIKEAILSLKIQRTLSKEEVLEGYLNTIYFGRGAYGIEAASEAYFDKKAKKLTLRESVALASILNNPTRFDPANGRDSKDALLGRMQYTLGNMVELDYATQAEADKAGRRLPKFPKIAAESAYGDQKGHMLTMVKKELVRLGFSEQEIDGGGLRVTTTFTQKAMQAAEEGVKEVRPKVGRPATLHIGVASVEPGTGAVRGFYAGQDYLESQLNWAVAGGQAGSTFKPFAVATALKEGYSLRDTFDGNSPYTADDGTEFENQGDSDYGSAVSLLTATEDSINTAFIDLTIAMSDGPEKIIETANDMGIPPVKAPRKDAYGFPDATPGLEPNTGVALGSQTVSPINMANGYATIANGGVAAEPFIIEKVEDAGGETLYEHKVVTDRAISTDIAADVSYALQTVVSAGSGTEALDLGRPAAGKTGTATKTGGAVSSSWFVGYTPQLSTAVMYVRGTGNGTLDDGWLPTSSDGKLGYFGGNYPAKTWVAVMSRDMEGLPEEDFPEPAYVDGDAPESGHAPYVPPAVPQQTTRPPSGGGGGGGGGPAETPTSEPPTSAPPTSAPPTSAPPTTAPPGGCGLLTGCPDPEPTQEPTQAPTQAPTTAPATPRRTR